jgi:hypothetical protein
MKECLNMFFGQHKEKERDNIKMVDYLTTFAVSKMASYVFAGSKNRDDIRDGNEYKIQNE